MNEMAMVEYLLKEYDFYRQKLESTKEKDVQQIDYFCGRCDQITAILRERFGMEVWFTGDTGAGLAEIVAKNSVCEVRVKRVREEPTRGK